MPNSPRSPTESRLMGLEVAHIFNRYGEAYRQAHDASLSAAQRRAMGAIELCRTAALGGHIERCDNCEHERVAYNSCLMGKICNGESAIDDVSGLAVFRTVTTSIHVHFAPHKIDLLPMPSPSLSSVVRDQGPMTGGKDVGGIFCGARGTSAHATSSQCEAIVPPHVRKGSFRPPDKLIALLRDRS